jgi:hypothetical protein
LRVHDGSGFWLLGFLRFCGLLFGLAGIGLLRVICPLRLSG